MTVGQATIYGAPSPLEGTPRWPTQPMEPITQGGFAFKSCTRCGRLYYKADTGCPWCPGLQPPVTKRLFSDEHWSLKKGDVWYTGRMCSNSKDREERYRFTTFAEAADTRKSPDMTGYKIIHITRYRKPV